MMYTSQPIDPIYAMSAIRSSYPNHPKNHRLTEEIRDHHVLR